MNTLPRKALSAMAGRVVLSLDVLGHWIADGHVAQFFVQFLED